MTEEQTDTLMSWATEAKELIESGGGFIADQSPLVIEEMLFRPWLNVGITGLTFIVSLTICIIIIGVSKGFETTLAALSFLNVCLSIYMCVAIYNVLQAHFTPRLYIIEQLSGLI